MGAPDLLQALRAQGFTLRAEDGRVMVAPAERITDELRAVIRANKAELLTALGAGSSPESPAAVDSVRDPAAKGRRERVSAMLQEHPGARYAVLVDDDADPEAAIVTLAIRDLATCELRIPRGKWDGVLFLELLERYAGTLH